MIILLNYISNKNAFHKEFWFLFIIRYHFKFPIFFLSSQSSKFFIIHNNRTKSNHKSISGRHKAKISGEFPSNAASWLSNMLPYINSTMQDSRNALSLLLCFLFLHFPICHVLSMLEDEGEGHHHPYPLKKSEI